MATALARPAVVVVLLTLLCGLVRTIGHDHLLPCAPEPDGLVLHTQVEVLERGAEGDRTQHLYGFYPLLTARIVALLTDAPRPDDVERTLADELERAAAHRARIRLVVAWLSALGTPFVFLIARRFMAEPWALCAAALFAFDPFVLWFAQQARPHAAFTAWTAATLWAALALARNAGWRECLVAALCAGGALSTLQSGASLFVPLFLATLWSVRSLAAAGRVACALGVVALVAWWSYPATGAAESAVSAGQGTLQLSGHKLDLSIFNGAGFAKVWAAVRDYDPVLLASTLAAAAALAFALSRARAASAPSDAHREAWTLFAWCAAYLLAIGLYQRTYQRFALPLVPAACVFAAGGAAALAARRKVVGFGFAAVVLACQAGLAIGVARARAGEDTLELAARAVEQHVPRGELLAFMPTVELPLWMDQASAERNAKAMDDPAFPWFQWRLRSRGGPPEGREMVALPLSLPSEREAARADPAAFLARLDARWFVIEDQTGRRPVLVALREELKRSARLVARFSPHADPAESLPLAYQDDEFGRSLPWTWRLASGGRAGPVVELWRLGD